MTAGAHETTRWSNASLLYSQANYHHLGLVRRLIKCLSTRIGWAVSSARPGGEIMADLALDYPTRLFQFVPESLAAASSQPWTHIYPSAAFGDLPILLGDRDTEITTVRHPLAGGTCIPRRRRRRLDTCYAQSSGKIEFVYLAEPVARTIDILAGGLELVARDQPALIFEVEAGDGVPELNAFLDAQRYVLLDSALQQVASATANTIDYASCLTETLFLALPRKFVERNGLVKAFWPHDTRLARHSGWQDAMKAGFSREARSGGICFAKPPSRSYHYPFDHRLVCDGFYAAEVQDGHWWRWLGPKPCARVRLTRPRPGRYQLAITVVGAADEMNLADVRLFVSGVRTRPELNESDGLSVICCDVDIAVDETASEFELVIAVPATYRASEEDPRRLGICISHIDLLSVTTTE